MTRVKPLVVSEDSLYNSSQLKDPVFAEGLRDWMARQMPMMPMGLLSDDAEHWEVQRPERFTVEDEQVLDETIEKVECRWCGTGSSVVALVDEVAG